MCLSRCRGWTQEKLPGTLSSILRFCPVQLAGALTVKLNLSLVQSAAPACLKTITMVPAPKKAAVTSLIGYEAVALSPVTTTHEKQFGCHAITTALHRALTHQYCANTNVRMQFVDFSSALNNFHPSVLISQLHELGLTPSTWKELEDFLTSRLQSVRSDS